MLALSTVSNASELRHRFKHGFSQRAPSDLQHSKFLKAQKAEPKALIQATAQVQRQAEFFDQLKKNFAQQSTTEEEAYLEIAKKLMKLSDVLVELEDCMDQQLKLKYNKATNENVTPTTPATADPKTEDISTQPPAAEAQEEKPAEKAVEKTEEEKPATSDNAAAVTV